MKRYTIYDIETLLNCFTVCFLDYETKKKKSFVLYDDINEFYELYKFLKRIQKHEYYLVGFNNIGFDSQIIDYIIWIGDNTQSYDEWTIEGLVSSIYNKAQEIINLPEEEKFKSLIPEWRLSTLQIDLFKQKHYDRPQKATSLKWLQFTMRRKRIKEMPFEHDHKVSKHEIEQILDYNWEDVDSTAEFFDKIMFETDLRLSLSEKFELNLLNAAEPRIAREIFGKFLSEQMGITYKELKEMRTFRKKISVKDIIFPYVSFKNPVFQNLLEDLKSTVLLPEEKYERIVQVYNLEATFALGGLHSNNNPLIVEEDEDWIIITSDVSSMYPNLAIENGVKPAHLGDAFTKVYKYLYDERKKYDKKDPVNYVYKIVLNSAYGLSSEKNSYLYDVQYTRTICINGELSLLMLCEKVKEYIPEAVFIMLNTDGIEVRIPRSKYDLYFKACEEWEQITRLVLEHGQYKKMIINDCNNYIAVDIKDNIKKKGLFETNLDFHKNPSFLVIPLALEAYFIKGMDYTRFIMQHKNIFDFCGAVKKKSNFKLNLYSLRDNNLDIESQQRVCRFIISNTGGLLKKDYNDGRQVSVIADKYVTVLDDIVQEDASKYNINKNWYISEVRKIIFGIEGDKSQLKLFI